jgi:diaminohydroxyphosphoribosylaminopyrimidine deaminase/5-amino-6-(5-phosphoribosylamino)uracil reductase
VRLTRAEAGAADARFMRRALELARRGLGRTHPNPPVGAVVVRAGRIVGEGWHRRAGTAHAEVIALAAAGERARGATLYCTLEPCSFVGRTPACAPRVVASRVSRVVLGTIDPHPRVRGRGVRELRRAGIAVQSGVEEEAARELIRFFAHHAVRRRPFVRLKLAASADGRIATATGESRWITGPLARRLVHRWRNELDAVMVGVETALADDPALTCRMARGRDPIRIVVDSRLRVPPRARLLREGRSPVWIATARNAPAARAKRLEAAGAAVLPVPGRGERVDLGALLDLLAQRGISSLLVEGGATLAASLLRAGLVDELCWFEAPLLIGGDGKPMIEGLGVRSMNDALALRGHRLESVGPDLLHVAHLAPVGKRRAAVTR